MDKAVWVPYLDARTRGVGQGGPAQASSVRGGAGGSWAAPDCRDWTASWERRGGQTAASGTAVGRTLDLHPYWPENSR